MALTVLKSGEMKAFCENIALMQSVGVQIDEAVHMLADSSESRPLEAACKAIYSELIAGDRLSVAMLKVGAFPAYAIEMVAAGERTGHLEDTLSSLAVYYDEEERLLSKIRQSIGYPTILLCVMSVVLAFVIAAILPIFLDVYETLAGGLAASSFGIVEAGVIIGWIALAITLICTVIAIIALASSRTAAGRDRIMAMLSKMPGAKPVFYDLALSRFTSTLSVYIASGSNSDDAMKAALASVEHPLLRARVEEAYESMIETVRAKSLLQAVSDANVYDPIHIRLLTFGMRSGRIDVVLNDMSEDLFSDAISGFDRLVDRVEPMLTTFVTIAIGLTLIAVMLPLIGMMGSVN